MIVAGALALVALLHIAFIVAMSRRLRAFRGPLLSDVECPPALVLLCLRGGDPFLRRTLTQLFQLDYPRYRVRIVLDSATDSAREHVDAVINELRPPHVEVVVLGERFLTCTYKMSGILWGTRNLPPDVQVVALMDGDTVPHAGWLRELATPLVTGGAACSTGNRWYFPDTPTIASQVRVCWGAAALTLMTLCRIPWGGTMAVRREIIEDPRLRDRIRAAFSEDTTIGQFVAEIGGRVHFDPRLVIVNHETTGLAGFLGFDTRQLLAVRLHHRGWKWIHAYNWIGSLLLVYPLARLSGWPAMWWTDALFAAAALLIAGHAILLGPSIRRMLRDRSVQLPGWNLQRFVALVIAVPVVQFVQLIAVLRACWMRSVVWRGVHYRIEGGRRLVVESPLPPTTEPPVLAQSA